MTNNKNKCFKNLKHRMNIFYNKSELYNDKIKC